MSKTVDPVQFLRCRRRPRCSFLYNIAAALLVLEWLKGGIMLRKRERMTVRTSSQFRPLLFPGTRGEYLVYNFHQRSSRIDFTQTEVINLNISIHFVRSVFWQFTCFDVSQHSRSRMSLDPVKHNVTPVLCSAGCTAGCTAAECCCSGPYGGDDARNHRFYT